jgi:hypothetical protein
MCPNAGSPNVVHAASPAAGEELRRTVGVFDSVGNPLVTRIRIFGKPRASKASDARE